MTWFLPRRQAPSAANRGNSRRTRGLRQQSARQPQRRLACFEPLESRSLLAVLPFGAYADDTGEYMLGDVHVTVVLMESDPALAPPDPTVPVENWTAGAIAAVKSNVQAGMQWWQDTLDAMPTVRDGLLNFTYDWTFANTPVSTGLEPIARVSNDFSLWIYDFLGTVGFAQTGNFSSDIRAYNNFKREQTGSDWAFTIFVVNNSADSDKLFAPGGSFSRAFAFAGGRFMVVPADRPASTFAHEAGHMFWALDEYAGGGSYTSHRGYYNTQNLNASNNPEEGFEQAPSIMASGAALDAAFAGHISSKSSLEMIGWKDSDSDGIFDVLDVPFSLDGIGRYDASAGRYRFSGTSAVRTLPNQNPSGLQNDITINEIRQVEYSLDGGAWQVAKTFVDSYQVNLDLSLAAPAGNHTIKIRTVDTRTGVMSPEFVDSYSTDSSSPSTPKSTPSPGVSGFVFSDIDGNGAWGPNEPALVDWAVDLLDVNGNQVNLVRKIEPNDYSEGASLNNVSSEATLTSVGSDAASNLVFARTSQIVASAGKVFASTTLSGASTEKWTANRRLRVDLPSPVTRVSQRALSSGNPSLASFGRLEAYDAAGKLLERYTTGALTSGKSELMTVSRATPDIAYIIVRGHAGSDVLLDSLQWGPGASATSNTLGAYSLSFLPPGNYRVRTTAPAQNMLTTPIGGEYIVSVSGGQSIGDLNFGIKPAPNPWHNFSTPLNVDNDANGNINAIDVLIVINWINANPNNARLPSEGNPGLNGYVDVDNNGVCNAIDVLIVINYINSQTMAPPPAGGEGEQPSGFAAAPGPSAAEGEEIFVPAANAAEYYARQPMHFLEIAGTDIPCCCGQCMSTAVAPAATASAPNSVLPTPASDAPPAKGSAKAAKSKQSDRPERFNKEEQSSLAARRADKLAQSIDAVAADVSKAWDSRFKLGRRGSRR